MGATPRQPTPLRLTRSARKSRCPSREREGSVPFRPKLASPHGITNSIPAFTRSSARKLRKLAMQSVSDSKRRVVVS